MYTAGTYPQKHVEVIRKVSVTQRGAPNYHADPRLYDVATSFPDLWVSTVGATVGSRLEEPSEMIESALEKYSQINKPITVGATLVTHPCSYTHHRFDPSHMLLWLLAH